MSAKNSVSLSSRILMLIRDSWVILGVTLLFLFFIEISARVMFTAKDTLVGKPAVLWCDRIQLADSYRSANWPKGYCNETNLVKMEWHPYVYWRRQQFKGEFINIDSNGIRYTYEQPFTTQCNESRQRIFLFGGSTMWGPGTRDEYTIPSHLAKLLENEGLCVEVINFGEQGYVSSQEVILLHRMLQQENIPTLAIFYDGINESFSAFQNGQAGLPQNEFNRRNEFNLLRDKQRIRKAFVTKAMLPEGIARLGAAIWARVEPNADNFGVEANKRTSEVNIPDKDKLIDDIAAVYRSNLELVQVLAEHYRFSTLFYWQPLIFTKQNLSEYEQVWHDQASGMWRNFLLTAYARVKQDEGLSQLTTFRDISDAFDNTNDAVYLDAFHLTEKGNLAIAREMLGDVVQELRETDEKQQTQEAK